ncbi:metal transporter CNNM4 [Hydra vulgaris]|uniref:metal transporter CNNM4 n=1 Tax=Hydra vulgaris TaxID=6087 RepID=UPI0002B492B6|nr:metal transporter CNNM4-like [Hydra vulgaris]
MVALFLFEKRYNVLSILFFFSFYNYIFAELYDINSIALYESSEYAHVEEGVIHVDPKTSLKLMLFGSNLKNYFYLSFSFVTKKKNENCDDDRETTSIPIFSKDGKTAIFTENFAKYSDVTLYPCLKIINQSDSKIDNNTQIGWIHLGDKEFLKIRVLKSSFDLPLWFKIILSTILMMLSAMFSGLNLGLMSFDLNELKIISTSSSIQNQKYAKKIIPVRRHGNFLLCTLLLGNTLVNSTFTIILDSLTSGIVAVIGSTLGIVFFGEIIPQSICSRFGLAVGAYTILLTKLFMVITFPLSFPISKILDRILGKELGNVYNKQQLLEMLKLQHEYDDLEQDEVGIISGALKYREKKVCQVMTALDDCFMLDEEAVLDFKTMSSVIKSGYSRIPIFSVKRSNIVAILFVKDLAFVDPDDCIPLLSVLKFYNHPVHKVFDDTKLGSILQEFKQGTTHISIVMKVNNDGEGDPFYECIGIVTLEDIIEEIIQDEIVDETDIYVDNVSGKKVQRKKNQLNHDFSMFLPHPGASKSKISPQLAFAIYQYLSTSVSVFSQDLVSKNVLKKIIQLPGVIEEKAVEYEKERTDIYLYQKGKPCDYFSLILQGRVEVNVGDEDITFEGGPFTIFGVKALTCEINQQFIPDYSVKVIGNVQLFKVNNLLYKSSLKASKLERENRVSDILLEYDDINNSSVPQISYKEPENENCIQNKKDENSSINLDDNQTIPLLKEMETGESKF